MSEIKADGSEVFRYDDPDFPVFCRHNFIPAGYDLHKWTPNHWHDEVELIYIEKGRIHHTVNGDYMTLHAGDGLYINSRQFHELITDKTEDCTLYCLIFNPRLLRSCVRMEEMINSIAENENLGYIFLKSENEWQLKILDDIREAVERSQEKDRECEVIGILHDIWNELYINTEKEENIEKYINVGQRLVKEMIIYIENNYKSDISLDDICSHVGIGKTKCTDLFNKYVHMAPVEFLRSLRLEKSVEYLKNTDMTISEIAYEVGFAGASYYGEYFKKRIGMTPLHFRKRYRMEISKEVEE